MRDLRELKVNVGGKPVQRPAPTPDEVAAFEAYLGARLPQAYRGFLEFANGGHPQVGSFIPLGGDPSDKWAVNRFYHLGPDRDDPGNIWKVTKGWRAVLGPQSLPIANDGGGNQIFINFSSTPPSVELCIHDESFRIVRVADSFEDFV